MKVLAETIAVSRKKLDEFIEKSIDVIDCYDLPEAPGGYPAPSSISLAVYLKTKYSVCSIPHIRLFDVNKLALLSIVEAVKFFELDALLLTMGDPPRYGSVVSDVTTDEAIEFIKELGYRTRIAVLVSLRYSLEDIMKRVSKKADMLFILRTEYKNIDKLKKVYNEAKKFNKEVYVYLLVGSDKNIDLFRQLNQPYIHYSEVEDFLNSIKNFVDGVIISSPKDKKLIIDIARLIKETM